MFLQNQILNGTYQILHPIGKGGTSLVYLAYHLRLQKHVVVKQLLGSYSADFLLRTEVDILKNLPHPNLPQVYDFIPDRGSVYTVIDYVNGYDLEAYIQSGTRFPEPLLKRYLRQMAEVLAYLHGQNRAVIHCDIKPGNIIINQDGNAILIDFNTSIGGNQGNLLGLTLPYASPEQIQLAQYALYNQQAPFELDERTDLFSLGATFYELISGIRPTPGVPPVPLHTMDLTEYSRDFLVLIDRLIEYDREKRVKSAKKLVAAIDRLDSRYWTYFVLRCASVLVSAALIAGGLYCFIRGTRRAGLENYREAFDSAAVLISQGYLDEAEDRCDEILASRQMQAFLQDEPRELARLYHAMGDIHYYRSDFGTATVYYRYALDLCGGEEEGVYLRDAAIAYAQSGDLDAARSLLQRGQRSQSPGEDLQLIAVVIDAREGDFDACVEGAQKLIDSSRSDDIRLRAALAVASASTRLDTRIQWLTTAREYDGGRTSLRGLAMAYGEKAQAATDEQERQKALKKAAELYRELCSSVYASSNDMLNYSMVLRMSGDLTGALQNLKTAQSRDPNNYRILANMCFISYEMGDDSKAAVYCKDALQKWRADTSADKPGESDEEIQNLLEIGRRYGIGGN